MYNFVTQLMPNKFKSQRSFEQTKSFVRRMARAGLWDEYEAMMKKEVKCSDHRLSHETQASKVSINYFACVRVFLVGRSHCVVRPTN